MSWCFARCKFETTEIARQSLNDCYVHGNKVEGYVKAAEGTHYEEKNELMPDDKRLTRYKVFTKGSERAKDELNHIQQRRLKANITSDTPKPSETLV